MHKIKYNIQISIEQYIHIAHIYVIKIYIYIRTYISKINFQRMYIS